MMDFFGDLVTTVGAAVSGGVTGLIGLAVRQGFEWLNRREERAILALKQAHEIAVINANAGLMDREWQGRAAVAKAEGEAETEAGNAAAFAASFQTEPQRYAEGPRPKGFWGAFGWFLMVLADLVKASIRPGLTIYLVVLTTMIKLDLDKLMIMYGMALDKKEVLVLVKMIIDTVLYLTVTCVTWWFGVRQSAKAPARA